MSADSVSSDVSPMATTQAFRHAAVRKHDYDCFRGVFDAADMTELMPWQPMLRSLNAAGVHQLFHKYPALSSDVNEVLTEDVAKTVIGEMCEVARDEAWLSKPVGKVLLAATAASDLLRLAEHFRTVLPECAEACEAILRRCAEGALENYPKIDYPAHVNRLSRQTDGWLFRDAGSGFLYDARPLVEQCVVTLVADPPSLPALSELFPDLHKSPPLARHAALNLFDDGLTVACIAMSGPIHDFPLLNFTPSGDGTDDLVDPKTGQTVAVGAKYAAAQALVRYVRRIAEDKGTPAQTALFLEETWHRLTAPLFLRNKSLTVACKELLDSDLELPAMNMGTKRARP